MTEVPKDPLPQPTLTDVLEYLAQMGLTMRQLAIQRDQPVLAYLYGLAEVEARRAAREASRGISSSPPEAGAH